MGDLGTYLGDIDWVGGLLVAAVAVTIAAIANWFLQASLDESLSVVPWLRSRIVSAIRARSGAPTETWICPTCRSVNDPAADFCYRGCGSREELELDLASDEAVIEHHGRT
jgi:hypothetical protein